MRLFSVFVGALLALAATACSAPAELASSPDASRIFPCEDGGPGPTSGGATFDSIYTELFSANGVAACQASGCHGGAMGQGALSLGTDKKGAYDGLVAYGQVDPTATTTDDPPMTVRFLLNTVKPLSNGVPRMPQPLCGKNRPLNEQELQRLKDWGKNGAKND